MNSLDRQVLEQARRWHAEGHAVWLVTVVETWGSAPRPPGALMALRDDGRLIGSVSGGCVEDDLVARVRGGERPQRPAVVTYGVTRDEAARFGLPCGGNLRLLQEPLLATGWIDELLGRTDRHELLARCLDVDSGQVTLDAAVRAEAFFFGGGILRAPFGPRWRLLIVGAGPASQLLAPLAQTLDFDVICCDPRDEVASAWNVPGARFSREMPDDLVVALRLDAHSAVVALTHDPKLDDMVLLEALKTDAFYVGALGARRHAEARRKRLALFDLTSAQIAALRSPVGLDIGSRTPAEIAVSIAADLVAARRSGPA